MKVSKLMTIGKQISKRLIVTRSKKTALDPKTQTDEELSATASRTEASAPKDKMLADVADIGKNIKLNIVREQEQKLIPVLARAMDAALRLEYYKFKDAARFVLKTIREELGGDVADQLTIDHLQGAYISMSAKYRDRGADSKKNVVWIASLDKIKADADKSANTQLKDQRKFKMGSLRPLAQEAIDHWKEFRPKMYRELKASGRLGKAAMEAAKKTLDEQATLIEQGYPPEEAWAVVRETYLFVPEETTPDMKSTRQYKDARVVQAALNELLQK